VGAAARAGARRHLTPGRRAARSRGVYLALVLLTVALGLASRRFAPALPRVVAAYAGDALWAAMVFWLLALARPLARTGWLAAAAFAIAAAVEASQLHRAPWLDTLRDTRAGALALGRGFLWSDLACYAVGVAAAALLDRALAAGGGRARRPGS
jgi:hypothetical protein